MLLTGDGIYVVIFVVIVLGVTVLTFLPGILRGIREKKLKETGTEAPARVVGLEDTGSRQNYNPVVKLRLEVRPADGPPFIATTQLVLSPVEIPRYQEGAEVRVKYDPRDHSSIVLLGR